MIRISTRTRYALSALIELAQHTEPLSIRKLAKLQGLPEKYLEQIFCCLTEAKLVESKRGAKGGYILTRDPEDITLLSIMQAVDESVCSAPCINTKNPECPRGKESCNLNPLWQEVSEKISGILNSYTLREIIEECQRRDHGGKG